MRAMPRRPLLVLALLCTGLGVATPGATAAGRADARAFTKATLAFDLARGNAIGRAERRGDARRRNAAVCAETLRSAPPERREQLFALYVAWVSTGYFVEDEPIFTRWVRALKRISTSDSALRRARISLGRQLAAVRSSYGQGRRFCSPVEAWARAGWSEEATPAPVRRLRRLEAVTGSRRPNAGVTAAAAVLRSRGGQGGKLAAAALREGIDEPDERVIQGDDPIVALLTGDA
jgi:hypothetical protein